MNHTTKTILSILALGVFVVGIALVMKNYRAAAPEPDPAPQAQSIGDASITINDLAQGQTITLPMTINGEVSGYFFEGSFPVFIKDPSGNQLGVGLASSTEDWMTANHIPFSVTLPAVAYQGPAMLVFTKDNPSGEPQYDASYVVNVVIQ